MIFTDAHLERVRTIVTAQVQGAVERVDEEVEQLLSELGLKIEERRRELDEDRKYNSKLIPVDVVVEELYRMRDEILDDALPNWGQIASGNIQARLDLWVHGIEAAIAATTQFNFLALRDVFREWVRQNSPRGLIVALQTARDRAIKRIVQRALAPRTERRRWKKVSSRNRG
jgi:hypothetical protein